MEDIKQSGNIKEEVVTTMDLIGCLHMMGSANQYLQPLAETGYI